MKLWTIIERKPGPAWADQWAELLGGEFALMRKTLLVEVPCHPTKFDKRKGRRVKISSADGKREWRFIPTKKLVRLEIDWRCLSDAVARAFGLANKHLALDLERTWQIGDFSGGALPVFLTVQSTGRDFRGVVAELAARFGSANPKVSKPFVVMAPTRDFFDTSIASLLDCRGAAFFDLESYLTISPAGQLVTRESGGNCFPVYCRSRINRQIRWRRREFL